MKLPKVNAANKSASDRTSENFGCDAVDIECPAKDFTDHALSFQATVQVSTD